MENKVEIYLYLQKNIASLKEKYVAKKMIGVDYKGGYALIEGTNDEILKELIFLERVARRGLTISSGDMDIDELIVKYQQLVDIEIFNNARHVGEFRGLSFCKEAVIMKYLVNNANVYFALGLRPSLQDSKTLETVGLHGYSSITALTQTEYEENYYGAFGESPDHGWA